MSRRANADGPERTATHDGQTAMNLIDQIARQAAMLPRDAQAQVLDFVEFLVKKYAADAPSEDEAWDQVAARELSPDGLQAESR